MAAPTLQAQGAINATINGNVTVTLPAYQANDIIVITSQFWGPNSSGFIFGYADMPFPYSSFQFLVDPEFPDTGDFIEAVPFDEIYQTWWARATSTTSLGTTATITRNPNWDTGADTCFSGRAYVIRGCDPNGTPVDYVPTWSAVSSAANPQLPAVKVAGKERLIVHFMVKSDNTATPTAATGYTVGTAATTTTGTDAAHQTYRRTADADVTAVTPTGGTANAANNGNSGYFSIAFRPNNPRYALIT